MNRRSTAGIAAATAIGATVIAGTAMAAAGGPTITASGGTVVRINKMIGDTQHYSPDVLRVKSGATVRLVNRSKEPQPHTLSLLKRSALPRTVAQINSCDPSGQAPSVCGPLIQAHQADPNTGEVKVALVDVGAPGFNTPGDKTTAGDSIYLPPKAKVSFKVTAKAGTTLYYFCAVHPWMQGEIKVTK